MAPGHTQEPYCAGECEEDGRKTENLPKKKSWDTWMWNMERRTGTALVCFHALPHQIDLNHLGVRFLVPLYSFEVGWSFLLVARAGGHNTLCWARGPPPPLSCSCFPWIVFLASRHFSDGDTGPFVIPILAVWITLRWPSTRRTGWVRTESYDFAALIPQGDPRLIPHEQHQSPAQQVLDGFCFWLS